MQKRINYWHKVLTALLASNLITLGSCCVYYVDPSATGLRYGTSWFNAFNSLDDALLSARTKYDEIWLKGGHTYIPSKPTHRNDCFFTENGISIYGGFTGTEMKKDDRVSTALPSIISGDIGIIGDNSDNCYHVITYNEQLLLDNVIIENGNANYKPNDYSVRSLDNLHRYGGGIITIDTNNPTYLTLQNVTIRNNTALSGGAMFFKGSLSNVNRTKCDVLIKDSKFEYNSAIAGEYEGGYGGAIYNYALGNVVIFDTEFNYNTAAFRGGALYQDYRGYYYISGSYFTGNKANGWGGAIFSEDRNAQKGGTYPEIYNSTFTENYADLDGGAIYFYNHIIATMWGNTFDSNVANGSGGAIALIASFIDDISTYYNCTNSTNSTNSTISLMDRPINWCANFSDQFINNTDGAPSNASDDVFFVSDYTYEEIDWDLSFDLNNELDELYSTYESMNQTETDLYPFNSNNSLCFVDISNGNTNQTGKTWQNAYNDLQDCLDQLGLDVEIINYYNCTININSTNSTISTIDTICSNITIIPATGGEIWVAAGKYIPTAVPMWKQLLNKQSNLYKTFSMYDNIRMYGGFVGTESIRNERNWRDYPTILSCKISNKLECSQILNSADNTLIDGFIFEEAGNGVLGRRRLQNSITVDMVLSSTVANMGAGIYSNSTTVSVVNTIFHKLISGSKGGAVYCIGQQGSKKPNKTTHKSPSFINVAFLGNRAGARGGAISADADCHFTCNKCKFIENSCSKKGGAIYLDWDADPIFTDTIFSKNYALESGGCIAADGESYVIFNGNTSLTNNWATMEGGCLYSGSGVERMIEQGFKFENIPIWLNNSMEYNIGQPNHWGWPYTLFENDVELPNYENITSKPTISPTPSPIPNINHDEIGQPNIIIFYVDDIQFTQDWLMSAPQGIELNNRTVEYGEQQTPNIAGFMKESLIFTNSYTAAPVCAPSRFAVITGRQPARNEWALERAATEDTGYLTVNVTIHTSKLYLNDSIYNIPYTLRENGYYTGMVGKWHIMAPNDNGQEYGCVNIETEMNANLYKNCKDLLKEQGFDYVDAWYYANIADDNKYFSHNPEWMVSQSQKIISEAQSQNKSFFLYFANTLTHTPSAKTALLNFTYLDSPKGQLTGSDVPDDTYMRTRQEIWEMALNYADSNTLKIDKYASYFWLDETFGALLTYLKLNNLYDNTMIVFMNDHAMSGKGLMYLQGSRIIQYIRYPPLFGDNGPNIIPNDFVVSNVDLAAVIFNISSITPPEEYIMDGISWVKDVQNYVLNPPAQNSIISPDCCQARYIDIFNSHSYVNKKFQYIFRLNPNAYETEMDVHKLYKYVSSQEQFYNLATDPSEQNNLANINSSISSLEFTQLERIREEMDSYIDSICPAFANETGGCIKPSKLKINRTFTEPTLDPNDKECNTRRETIYFNQVRKLLLKGEDLDWDSAGAIDFKYNALRKFYREQGRDCASSIDDLQYYYMFSYESSGRAKRFSRYRVNLLICCNKTFASDWVAPLEYVCGYDPNLPDCKNKAFIEGDLLPEDPTSRIAVQVLILCSIFTILTILCVAAYWMYSKSKKKVSFENDEKNIEITVQKDEEKNNNSLPQIPNNQTRARRAPSHSESSSVNSTKELVVRNRNSTKDNGESNDNKSKYTNNNKLSPKENNVGNLSPIPGSPPEAVNIE